eukprot:Rmarinus@m.9899
MATTNAVYRVFTSSTPQYSRTIFKRIFGGRPSKELIGDDPFGNQYFIHAPEKPGGLARRTVEQPKGEYDPKTIPPEWMMWLKFSRDFIPTHDEVLTSESKRDTIRMRAEAIARNDAKLSLQQRYSGETESTPFSFQRVRLAMRLADSKAEDTASSSSSPSSSPSQSPHSADPSASGSNGETQPPAAPEASHPAGSRPQGASPGDVGGAAPTTNPFARGHSSAGGSGGGFRPEAWQPGKRKKS